MRGRRGRGGWRQGNRLMKRLKGERMGEEGNEEDGSSKNESLRLEYFSFFVLGLAVVFPVPFPGHVLHHGFLCQYFRFPHLFT